MSHDIRFCYALLDRLLSFEIPMVGRICLVGFQVYEELKFHVLIVLWLPFIIVWKWGKML